MFCVRNANKTETDTHTQPLTPRQTSQVRAFIWCEGFELFGSSLARSFTLARAWSTSNHVTRTHMYQYDVFISVRNEFNYNANVIQSWKIDFLNKYPFICCSCFTSHSHTHTHTSCWTDTCKTYIIIIFI